MVKSALLNFKPINMSVFEDTGFDLLPKIPQPGNTLVTSQPIEPPVISPPANTSIVVGAPDQISPKKGGSTFGWFLFGLLLLGSIGMTNYMAKKDSGHKEKA